MISNQKCIGLYDSGIGGLSILKELISHLPHHEYHYLADTLYLPYGEKSKDEVEERISSIHRFMKKNKKTDLLITACNTASALLLKSKSFSSSTRDVIQPTIQQTLSILEKYNKKRVGVLATPRTVESNIYPEFLNKERPDTIVFQEPSPLLSDFIESGKETSSDLEKQLKVYLEPLIQNEIEILIPGCTHYLLIIKKIQQILPSNVQVVDVRQTFIDSLPSTLQVKNGHEGGIHVYYTKKSSNFTEQVQKMINESCQFYEISI